MQDTAYNVAENAVKLQRLGISHRLNSIIQVATYGKDDELEYVRSHCPAERERGWRQQPAISYVSPEANGDGYVVYAGNHKTSTKRRLTRADGSSYPTMAEAAERLAKWRHNHDARCKHANARATRQ